MGRKDPGRRAKLRADQKPKLDDEMTQLASVLAEMQLDNNAYGWFRPPWRNGMNAAKLALQAARLHKDPSTQPELVRGEALVTAAKDLAENATYEQAGQLYASLIQPKLNMPSATLIAAGMRCLQLLVANSHGGGAVYNEVLIPVFLPVEPSLVEKAVLHARCFDSIGTSARLRGDRNDRQRAAFVTAWRRGLYLAAYSLPPAV